MAGKQTGRRQQIYNFIRSYQEEHGYGPSVREIGEACGGASTSVVAYHLARLEEEGGITRAHGPRVARSIRIVV